MSALQGLGLKRLAGDAGITLGRQLAVGLLQMVLAVAVARALGPAGNGRYAVALLLPTMLAALLNLGIAPANVYFLGAGLVDAATVFRAVNRLAAVIVIFGSGVGAACILIFGDKWFPDVPATILWGALSIFPFALYQSFLSSIFQGLQKFRLFNLIMFTQPAVTLLIIFSLISFGSAYLEYILAAYLSGFLVMVCISLAGIRRELRTVTASCARQGYFREAVSYGIRAHLSNILAFVNYRADIFLLNVLISPAVTGIYVVAVQIVERLWLLSQSISTVILPRLSELSADEEKRKQLTPVICRTVTVVTLLGAILLIFIAYPFITIFFGKEYVQAVPALICLLPGIVAGAGARILANDIAARKRPELNMYFSMVVVTVNVAGNVLLIPWYGLVGAAIATSFAYMINLVLRLIVYKRISGNLIRYSILATPDDVKGIMKMLKSRG